MGAALPPIDNLASLGLMEHSMSARFFFDLANGKTLLRDDKGVESGSLAEVMEQAGAVVAELRESGELFGVEPDWVMHVRGQNDDIYERITIS
jgi:hypothetical protein